MPSTNKIRRAAWIPRLVLADKSLLWQAVGLDPWFPSCCRRHEKLALDLRTQLGGMDGRLASAEGRAASQLGAVDALQMQVCLSPPPVAAAPA